MLVITRAIAGSCLLAYGLIDWLDYFFIINRNYRIDLIKQFGIVGTSKRKRQDAKPGGANVTMLRQGLRIAVRVCAALSLELEASETVDKRIGSAKVTTSLV